MEKCGVFKYSVLDDGTISLLDFASDSIENLEIPEKIDGKVVSTISRGAFGVNKKIKTVKIPHTVKRIEEGAFSFCDKLESVEIGDGVETINSSFINCRGLKKVCIGKALTGIGSSFQCCYNNKMFVVDPDNKYLCSIDGILFSKDRTVLIFCPCGKEGKYVIPPGTKMIGKSAFECTRLNEIVISNTVEKIESRALGDGPSCSLIVPSSVKDIALDAISLGKGVGGFEGELVVEQDSYAYDFFYSQRTNHPIFGDECHWMLVVVKDLFKDSPIIPNPSMQNDKLFCRHCGQQLPLDSNFCFKCGTKVETHIP